PQRQLAARLAANRWRRDPRSLDVTAPKSGIAAQIQKTLDTYGGFEVLINNAGCIEAGTVEETRWEVIRALLPRFREKRSGIIVFVSSIANYLDGAPGAATYGSSKGAINGEHEPFSAILGPRSRGNFKHRIQPVAAYAEANQAVDQVRSTMEQHSPGGVKKGADLIVDVVRSEGKATGKKLPESFFRGTGCAADCEG
ncbi:MAG: hypothetical protein LQ340_006765, partial [Diploschistes diacapsis]